MPSLAIYNVATCLFTCFCFDIVFFFLEKRLWLNIFFTTVKVRATKIYLQMLTNATLSYLFMRKTATAKTNQDRIVVLAKPVFLEMNKLTQVKEK